MALIPDIAAHGLSFMHFFFHVEGGFEAVAGFWRRRGVQASEWAGLSYFEISGLSSPLTVSIQWRRAAKDCCDVRLAIDAEAAESLDYPQDEAFRIDEDIFRSFFDLVSQQDVGGILARYGAIISGGVPFPLAALGAARLKRVVIEAGDSPTSMTLDFIRRRDGEWLVSIEPERLLQFTPKPVDDEFFEAPLKAATILVTPLIGLLNEKRTAP